MLRYQYIPCLLTFWGCSIDVNPLSKDNDNDGYSEFAGDCDDENPRAYPGAAFHDSMEDCMLDEDEDVYSS